MNHNMILGHPDLYPGESVIRKSAEIVKYNRTSDVGPEFLSSNFVDFLAGRNEYLPE